ncbi:MAG: MFS transporter [Dehalococcoidales bacterium]|nr:MFS transporter [Dehalococcoidales bacterium]
MSRYFIFATVGLVLLLASISGSAVSVAFPNIISSLDTSLILAGWVLSIYQLTATAAMPLCGKAADIFGGKRLFLISVTMFTAGSFFCAIAPNIQLLIFARLVQALGGGGFLPIASGIVAEQFPKSRQQAIGLFSSIFPIGQIIGPNLGGWMTHAFGWESIFWFNVPFGIIVLIISIFTLKSEKAEGGKMDMLGAGYFSGALCALMIALGELGNTDKATSWIMSVILFVLAVVFIIAFLRHEKRVINPIIDLQMLREKPFLAANVFNFLFGVCVFGVMSFVPLYAVSILNMTTLESGLILTPRSIGMIAASVLTSTSLKRWGYRMPMLIGTVIVVCVLSLLAFEFQGINIGGIRLNSMTLMMVFMLLMGVGMGIINPAANNACIDLMPDRVSTITGVRGMFRQTGGALSISITTLLLHYFGSMVLGFRVVLFGLALILVASIPLIYMMPSSPTAMAPSHDV